MNTRKTVYEKLFRNNETQLATHEVELASLQNVTKLDDAAFKLKDKALILVQKAKESLSIAINNSGQTITAFEKVILEVDALEKSVKDLGVTLPNEARIARDSAKREVSQFTELKNKVSSIKF